MTDSAGAAGQIEIRGRRWVWTRRVGGRADGMGFVRERGGIHRPYVEFIDPRRPSSTVRASWPRGEAGLPGWKLRRLFRAAWHRTWESGHDRLWRACLWSVASARGVDAPSLVRLEGGIRVRWAEVVLAHGLGELTEEQLEALLRTATPRYEARAPDRGSPGEDGPLPPRGGTASDPVLSWPGFHRHAAPRTLRG